MRFSKLFDVDDTQLLCVLQPREEDGAPEIKMITYVGDACIVMGNHLPETDDAQPDDTDLVTRTRAVFDGIGQTEAEQAYRMAKQLLAQALESKRNVPALQQAHDRRDQAPDTDSRPQPGDTDSDFGIPLLSTAIH